MLVSYICENILSDRDPHLSMYGLIHDAHEAITADIPTPVKCDCIRGGQEMLDVTIYSGLEVRMPTPEQSAKVKDADNMAFYAEAKLFGSPELWKYITENNVHCRGGKCKPGEDPTNEDAVRMATNIGQFVSDPRTTDGEGSPFVKEFIFRFNYLKKKIGKQIESSCSNG
jgi:hypothetical protein